MKKFYLLLVVILANCAISHAQSYSPFPFFAEEIDDAGIGHTHSHIKFSVYPNPTNGNFTVSLGACEGAKAAVWIVDINGRIAAYKEVEDCEESSTVHFNLANLRNGLYFVRVEKDKKIKTTRFYVSR